MTDSELEQLRRFCEGDLHAYETFYAVYGQRIYRFCHRLCSNSSDAEDLTQEVFLAAFQGRRKFQGRASLTTWIYRIALYRCRARLASPNYCNIPLPDEETSGVLTVDPMPSAIERIALEHAIAALPISLRETFLLVKAEGLTCREAASVLDIPIGTVKYRIHEASGRLRELLALDMDVCRSENLEALAAGEVIHEM